MADPSDRSGRGKSPPDPERLSAALRANLARRKAQQRARDSDKDVPPENDPPPKSDPAP